MTASSYDGRKPEPPYHTDSDIVVDLQGQIDELTAERDHLRADLQRLQSSPAPVVGGVPELTEQEIDAAIDRILKASGSALRHYTMALNLERMRGEMREILASRLSSIKPGEVVVERKLLRCIEEWVRGNESARHGGVGYSNEEWLVIEAGMRQLLDALRAQATTSGEVGNV